LKVQYRWKQSAQIFHVFFDDEFLEGEMR